MKQLILLTESFPFGNSETFLEQEVKILSKHFSFIKILPRSKRKGIRSIPLNCTVDLRLTNFSFTDFLTTTLKNFFFINHIEKFLRQFKKSETKLIRSLRYFIGMCLEGHLINSKITDLVDKNTVCYSYWLKSTALGLSLFDSPSKNISRAHGSDIYELNYTQAFHNFIGERLSVIYTVSNYGKIYLQEHYSIDPSKVKVAYLGTVRSSAFVQNNNRNSPKILLVSCSNCITLKRLDHIFQAVYHLANTNPEKEFEYHHFGAGPMLKTLKETSEKRLLNNLLVKYHGQTENERIHNFYQANDVSTFINFSTSEGLPVSIMEAISYGIPVVASDVGGTSEIVDKKVGKLLNANANAEILSKGIGDVAFLRHDHYPQAQIIDFWDQHFNAIVNYTKFAKELIT